MTEKGHSRKKQYTERDDRLFLYLPIAVIVIMTALIMAADRKTGGPVIEETETSVPAETETEPPTLSEEELEELELQTKIDEELSGYQDLGLVNTDGFINMRSAPDANDMTNIIGLLNNKAAFDLLEDQGEWLYISSGGLTGYIASRFCVRGEEALLMARNEMAMRAIVRVPSLNIRSEAALDPENVVGKAIAGERYLIREAEGDWALVDASYINGTDTPYINTGGENCEIRFCLDEARNRDLREMALTQFENIVVCHTDGYINVRKEPKAEGIANICGKFLAGNGAELLEETTENGYRWYKIRSGNVTGYVVADYCATGQEAKALALENATLTARIKTDNLNVRTGPSTDNEAWTQVVTGQAYAVLDQCDGWVKIDLESSDDDPAYISTQNGYVELKYGLSEAVEYYPAIEAANKAAAFRNSIVNYACQFVGNPYVWGGTSLTKGCDCSGFVQSVLKHFGIYLERTSYNQAKQGKKITSDQMKPGDLVFYANKSGTINHVGMYIGNGCVVNAASRKAGIKIYKWNYRKPVAIRNVIGE